MQFEIYYNQPQSKSMWLMKLKGDTSSFRSPGQFVNIAVDDCFLRRPFSVCRYDNEELWLLYDVVGKGTEIMTRWQTGRKVEMLTALGNGFSTDIAGKTPILMGGGCGVAPMLGLAETLLKENYKPIVALGFNSATDIVLADAFENIGITPLISTVDGSAGIKGFVTDAIAHAVEDIKPDKHYFFTCGPLPMLRNINDNMNCDGQLSFDTRMACGFGICMCCSVKTADGARRVCKDGPVFLKNELIWS